MDDETIRVAGDELRRGRRVDARRRLEALLQADPTSADAWYLLSLTTDDVEQQAECLLLALQHDPEHWHARRRSRQLRDHILEPDAMHRSEFPERSLSSQDSFPQAAERPSRTEPVSGELPGLAIFGPLRFVATEPQFSIWDRAIYFGSLGVSLFVLIVSIYALAALLRDGSFLWAQAAVILVLMLYAAYRRIGFAERFLLPYHRSVDDGGGGRGQLRDHEDALEVLTQAMQGSLPPMNLTTRTVTAVVAAASVSAMVCVLLTPASGALTAAAQTLATVISLGGAGVLMWLGLRALRRQQPDMFLRPRPLSWWLVVTYVGIWALFIGIAALVILRAP